MTLRSVIFSVCLTVKPVGEPDAGNPHVRFDERGWETERCRMAELPRPSSTLPKLPKLVGQSMSALPGNSDINLFCYGQGVIDLDAEVSDGAFDLGVAEQKLHGPQVACAPVDQGGFGPSE
jgi:hypothetical protein